ncbi:TolC family protein [Terasakiella sp. A23]|uniref:TolC family protein n=1 Tax=Terasakiella sp. FCG-A23 TaxID=3080561 RepID=UPI0029532AA3|nr:TolC family protein [Terasakiella sp. A23]MDV7338311.1 TolC family protein [Terasakiella sp. A23]
MTMGLGLKRFLQGTASALVMMGIATSASANPLVNELIYLLENYPSIKAKASLTDAAREDISAAYGLNMPTVSVSGDTGYQHTDQPSKDDYRVQGNLTATYNLFDGQFAAYEAKGAEVLHQSTLTDLSGEQSRIIFRGIQAYLNLVLQNKLVEISQTNVKLVEQIKTFIESESQVGRMSQADLLQARARLAQAREALIAYQGAQRQGQNRYFQLFQRVPTSDRMQDPLAPTEIVPENLEEAIRLARKHNPILQSSKLVAEAAQARIGSVESGAMPRIDVEASGDSKYNVDGVDGSENEGTVLLKLNWNLFDGNRVKAQTRAAALRYNAALMDSRHKHLENEEQVRNAYALIETERRRFRTLQEAEQIASEAFNARHEMMQSGKETIINVLDTALELLNVRIAVTSSDYSHRLANYQLLLATGQLTQDNIAQLVVEGQIQPAVADESQLIQKLIDGKAMPQQADTMAPSGDMMGAEMPAPGAYDELAPMQLEAQVRTGSPEGYNDMAAFESAHGAPYSDELAPEAGPTGPIELGPSDGPAGYYLVLGSFSEPNYAQDRITLAGMENAFVKPVDVNGTTYSRVLVGPLSQSEAENGKAIAQDRGIPDSWVLKE